MKDEPMIHNSMGDRVSRFRPRGKGPVKIFTCGPSIYARPHVGNFRTFIFQDIFVRYLRYLGFQTFRSMNLTDVEDKAIQMAQKADISVKELTERNESRLWSEWDRLGLERPDRVPRSSRSIEYSIKLIKLLLIQDIAYFDGKDVFYDPARFQGFGRLFGIDMSKWPENPKKFRKDTYPGVQWNLGDFILWHGCGEKDRVCWDEELGSGRPSWNVQDPAMCWESLGTEIDIWMGGWDNLWRHHDYNIAVMEGAHGVELAPYWLHSGHLLINGKKMSKSKGNVLYTEDLEKEGYSPSEIRFYLSYGSWRGRKNLTFDEMKKSEKRLRDMRRYLGSIESSSGDRTDGRAKRIIDGLEDAFIKNMNNNMDIRSAFNGLYNRIQRLERYALKGRIEDEEIKRFLSILIRIDQVLGFIF